MRDIDTYITEKFRLRDDTVVDNGKSNKLKIARYFGVDVSDVEYLYDKYFNTDIGDKGHTDDMGPCCTDFEAFLMYAVNYAHNYGFNPYDYCWFDDDHDDRLTYAQHYEKWMNEHPDETKKFIRLAEKMTKHKKLNDVFGMYDMLES